MNELVDYKPYVRTPMPSGERRPSIPFEVLEKVLTTTGESMREYWLQRVGNGKVVGVIMYGTSGTGKTTVTRQHGAHLWHNSLPDLDKDYPGISIKFITSGAVMTEAAINLTDALKQGRLGELKIDHSAYPLPELDPEKDLLTRAQLTPPMWGYIGDLMANKIIDATTHAIGTIKSPVMEIVIGDVSGLGKNARLAGSLRKVNEKLPGNLLYIATPANPGIEDKAIRVRTKTGKILVSLLSARKAGKNIGLNAADILTELSPKEKKGIDRFFKREHLVSDAARVVTLLDIYEGADPDRLQQMSTAFDEEVNEYAESIGLKAEQHPLYGFLKVVDRTLSDAQRAKYARRLLFAQDSLQTMIGLPKGSDLGTVAIIPYVKKDIHNYPDLAYRLAA